MTFTRAQIQSAYKKLPGYIQSIATDPETTEKVAREFKKINLSTEHSILADGEIFSSMLALQSLDDAINNIAKISGKNTGDLSELKSMLKNEIFNQYKVDINEFIEVNKSAAQTASVPEIPPKILPAVEPGETAHEVPHQELPVPITEAPISINNLKPEKPEPSPTPKYTYPGGADPYREPIE